MQSLHNDAQWWPPNVLRARQRLWLQEILRIARDSSLFHRQRLLGSCGLSPNPDGLDLVPPLKRADLAEQAREIARASRRAPRPPCGSGGAVSVPIDRETHRWHVAGIRRGFQWWGIDPADRVASIVGRSWASRLGQGLARAGGPRTDWRQFVVDERFDARILQVVRDVGRFRPAVIYGYPSAVHALVRAIWEGAGPRFPLKAVVLTGEPLYLFQRQDISHTLECPVVEEYGSAELGSVALECPDGTLHVAAETVFLETVPGEGGGDRVLATHLRNRVFPLIRYDTEDIGLLDSDSCECGRGLPTLRVLGRASDRLEGASWESPARPLVERCLGTLSHDLKGHARVLHPSAGVVVIEVERARSGEAGRLDGLRRVARDIFEPEWQVGVRLVDRLVRLRSGKLPYFVRMRPTARQSDRSLTASHRHPRLRIAWSR